MHQVGILVVQCVNLCGYELRLPTNAYENSETKRVEH